MIHPRSTPLKAASATSPLRRLKSRCGVSAAVAKEMQREREKIRYENIKKKLVGSDDPRARVRHPDAARAPAALGPPRVFFPGPALSVATTASTSIATPVAATR